MFDHVIVGVNDFEGDRSALWLARALAPRNSELLLAHVQIEKSTPAPDSGAARRTATRQHALQRLVALREELRLDAEVVCEEAPSARRGLHDMARTWHADLLVIGASRRDDMERDLVGDDTRELLEDAPCAVAVAPRGYSEPRLPLMKIGVAYDESPKSGDALTVARTLAAERNASLSAVHAVQVPVNVRDPGDVKGQISEDAVDARERMEKLGDVEGHIAYGDTVEELVRYGRTVDLLVLGSHRYGPVSRMLEQSTAQRLADEGSCALLVLSHQS
jgi:nucleotide-binding universal stress UspA family protein